jgi:transcriptional regulator with XRE-family HTH domain
LTQSQLAEKLGITDRAVSKWETGKSLPDASIMLELCGILNITVNDLLNGEVVPMDEYTQELEKKLLEMIKEKEQCDKRLLTMEWVIGGLSMIILFVPIFISAYAPLPEWQKLLVMFSGFIHAIVGFSLTMKVEQVAGYYACKHCGHRYVPELKAMYAAPHMGRTRWMRCPACGQKSWQKKVLQKEEADA